MTNVGRLVLVLSVGHLLSMSDRSLFAAAVPVLKATYRLSDTQLGILLGPAYAVVFGIAALGFGYLADRGHRPALILWGMVVWTLASAATGLCDSFPAFALMRSVMALGQAAFIPAAVALLVDASGTGRAKALAGFTTASSLGRGGVLLVAGAILAGAAAAGLSPAREGWRWMFVVTIVPNVCLLLPLGRLARRGDREARMAEPVVATGGTSPSTRIDRVALGAYFFAALPPTIIAQSFQSWLPTLLVRTQALSVAQAATQAGVLTLASAPVGQIAGGWIMARSAMARRHPMLVIATALMLTLPFLAVTGWSRGSVVASAGVVGAGIMIGIALFAGLFGLQALVPGDRRGVVNGAFMAMVTLAGLGLGPVLTGMLSDGPRRAAAVGATAGGVGLDGALLLVGAGAAALAMIAAVAGHGLYGRTAGAVLGVRRGTSA